MFASIDGVHCDIEEPRKCPSKKWYSHKSNGPGLTYQIILSLHENKLLSVIGPYPAGETDLHVFRKRDGIINQIPPGKRLIGDRGYVGEDEKISTPNEHDALEVFRYKNRARSRHETFNKRLKEFNVLSCRFRHLHYYAAQRSYDLDKHKKVFESICILVQYDLKHRPLFEM